MPARRERRVITAIVMVATAIVGCSSSDYDDDTSAPPPTPAPPAAGDTFALTSDNRLVTFNRSAPAIPNAVRISGLLMGEDLLGIDIRPGGTPAGELYALSDGGRIYTINVSTGAATRKGMLVPDPADTTNPFSALDGTDFGVDFNPVSDRLRIVSNTGQNLRVNADTGATHHRWHAEFGGRAAHGSDCSGLCEQFRRGLPHHALLSRRGDQPRARHERSQQRRRHGCGCPGREPGLDARLRDRDGARWLEHGVRSALDQRCAHPLWHRPHYRPGYFVRRGDRARFRRTHPWDGDRAARECAGAGAWRAARCQRDQQAGLVQQRRAAETLYLRVDQRRAGRREHPGC